MSLESREDYVRFNEHLWELDSIIKSFAELNGYEYDPPLTNGLYPKLRLWRIKDGISQNINLDMGLTDREERFDEFFPSIPYSVFAGSWIEGQEERIRYHGPHVGIRRIPFSKLKRSLHEILNHIHNHNEMVTPDLVYACGMKSPIHGHPKHGETLYL